MQSEAYKVSHMFLKTQNECQLRGEGTGGHGGETGRLLTQTARDRSRERGGRHREGGGEAQREREQTQREGERGGEREERRREGGEERADTQRVRERQNSELRTLLQNGLIF